MAFIDAQLSDRVAYGFKAGPQYMNQVISMANGREKRAADWMYPRIRFSASYENFKQQYRDEILAAFHACRGRLHCFKFKDWTDSVAVNEAIAPEIGTTDAVQLVKTYTFGAQTAERMIQCTDSSVTLTKDGSPFTAYTLDADTGLVTPDAAWGAGEYAWSGPVLVWVRFDNDYNAFSIDEWDSATANIELIEVRR